MTDERQDSRVLREECGTWCRYLIEQEPSPSVLARYVDAHARGVVEPRGFECAFDRALIVVARRGAFFARLCDVHARIFRPAGLLRRKLVLTLALLEVDAQAHRRVDLTSPGSRSGLVFAAGVWIVRFGLLAGLGLLLFVPVRAYCALSQGRRGTA